MEEGHHISHSLLAKGQTEDMLLEPPKRLSLYRPWVRKTYWTNEILRT